MNQIVTEMKIFQDICTFRKENKSTHKLQLINPSFHSFPAIIRPLGDLGDTKKRRMIEAEFLFQFFSKENYRCLHKAYF